MTAETIEAKALAAADAAIARLGLTVDMEATGLTLLRSAIALGWVEGWQAGGTEAQAILANLIEGVR